MNTQKKNKETTCFLKLVARTEIKGTVMMSDDLNAASSVSSKISEYAADYLILIKSYRDSLTFSPQNQSLKITKFPF